MVMARSPPSGRDYVHSNQLLIGAAFRKLAAPINKNIVETSGEYFLKINKKRGKI